VSVVYAKARLQHPKLGDVVDFVRGITFKPSDVVPVGEPGNIACFRTKNVQVDELDISDVWGIPATFVKRAEKMLRPGDILVSTANSWNLVGKCCWVPNLPWPATLGGFISALRPKMELVEPRYLYRWFSSAPIQSRVRSCARQTTNIANLSAEQCLDLQIPLPPFDEQKRIAAILDQADHLRRLRQRAIDRLNELGQVIFDEMFNGETCFTRMALGEVANLKRGPFGGALKKEIFAEHGYKVYEQGHVIQQDWTIDRYFIDECKFREMNDFSVLPHDLLVTCSGTLAVCRREAGSPSRAWWYSRKHE